MSTNLKPGALGRVQLPTAIQQFAQRLVNDLAVIEQAPLLAADVVL